MKLFGFSQIRQTGLRKSTLVGRASQPGCSMAVVCSLRPNLPDL